MGLEKHGLGKTWAWKNMGLEKHGLGKTWDWKKSVENKT